MHGTESGQDDQTDLITLPEILAEKKLLKGAIWRGLAFSIGAGIVSAFLFIGVTWLSGILIKPIKSEQVYWTVGWISFASFGLMALFGFLHDWFQQRSILKSLESRIRAGERLRRSDQSLIIKHKPISATYRVGLFPYKAIGWIGLVFFLFCGVMSAYAGQTNATPLFLPFVIMSAYMLLSASHLELTDSKIIVVAPYSRYEMRWEDVERIEQGDQGTLVFHGKGNKRLVFTSPSVWSWEGKLEMITFLGAQIEARGLSLTPSSSADYKIHKNVRV